VVPAVPHPTHAKGETTPPGEEAAVDVDVRPETVDAEEGEVLLGVPVDDRRRDLPRAGGDSLSEVAILALLEAFADRVGPRVQALDRLAREMPERVTELTRDWSALLGAVRARPALASTSPLTPRELRVLQLAALDRDNAEIAAELGVHLETVRTHWRHVYGKLGVHTRSGAVGRLFGQAPKR
jgi:DNA-binding CsgD family transcriptional regulator